MILTKKSPIGEADDFRIRSREVGHRGKIVLREGYLWAAPKISIPCSKIENIKDYGIHLNVRTDEVEESPSFKPNAWLNYPVPRALNGHSMAKGY